MRFRFAEWYVVPLALFALVMVLIVLRWRAVVKEDAYEAPFGFSVMARVPEAEATAPPPASARQKAGPAPALQHASAAAEATPGRPEKANAAASAGQSRKTQKGLPPKRLDLNHATAAELTALPGVGPVLAGRVVSYRNEHGHFKTLDELDKVKGVGPKMIEKLRPLLYVSAE